MFSAVKCTNKLEHVVAQHMREGNSFQGEAQHTPHSSSLPSIVVIVKPAKISHFVLGRELVCAQYAEDTMRPQASHQATGSVEP